MKARLLIASLIITIAATSQAQNWVLPPRAPFSNAPDALNVQENLQLLLQGAGTAKWEQTNNGILLLPSLQRIAEPPPQQGTRDDVPKFELPTIQFDSTALFNASDLAGVDCGAPTWYGRGVEPGHDYDPEILISGHHGIRDSGILITNNGAKDLMLWYSPKSEHIDSSFWKQFPSLRIDSNSYNALILNEDDLLGHHGNGTLSYYGNQITIDADAPLTGTVQLSPSSNYYYKKDGKRYYMQKAHGRTDIDPDMVAPHSKSKATRVGSSDLWLIDSGSKK